MARRSVALFLGLVLAAAGGPTAVGAEDPPRRYTPSEMVPSGTRPPPSKSGFAGDRSDAPSIAAQSRSFGQVAARSGIGLKTYRYSIYGNASTLDVYTPRPLVGKRNRTVRTVVLVHGGAWQMGDRIDLEAKAVQLVKQLGVVVVSVNYRLATEAVWPAQRDDVNAAVAFVRAHARQFNVDTRRVVLLGSSAGGQIAAATATYGTGGKRFKGLVTLSGLLSPLLMVEKDPAYSNGVIPGMLLRCLPSACPDRYRSATAVTQLDVRDMPSLLFHSLEEEPWDPTQAREFARSSRAAGVPSKLVVLPGELHGIDAWRMIWPTLRGWLLDRLGSTDRRGR